MSPQLTDTLPGRDRIIVAGLLLLVAALAWAFTVHQAIRMDEMEAAMWRDMNMSMNGMQPSWHAVDAVMLFVMWSAMMAAMMVPGASPMITAFSTINYRRRERAAPYVPTAAFLLGYLVVWAGFSVIATALQWLLQAIGLLTTMMQSSSYYWSAALFVAAGLYQLSPLKEICLAYCRSPDGFHSERMARRPARCRRDGDAARLVLRRLLRGPYAAPFRRCRDGLALGRGLGDFSDEREASARSKNLAADDRCWVDCRRGRVGASRLESGITQNSASLRVPHPRYTCRYVRSTCIITDRSVLRVLTSVRPRPNRGI